MPNCFVFYVISDNINMQCLNFNELKFNAKINIFALKLSF